MMDSEERTSGYGKSLILEKKFVKMGNRLVEVRLIKMRALGGSFNILPSARWAKGSQEAIKEAFDEGYRKALEDIHTQEKSHQNNPERLKKNEEFTHEIHKN